MDKTTIDGLLNDLEDEDDAATGKKGLAALGDDSAPQPADSDAKLQALVAALSPEEKAKLRELLDADAGGAPKPPPPEAPQAEA